MKKRTKKRLLKNLLAIAVLLAVSLYLGNQPKSNDVQSAITSKIPVGFYEVAEVFDGDTISVNMEGKVEKIRFIGVDTPETHHPSKPVQCFGVAASDFTKKTLRNTPVRLEADSQSTNRDRYDRLLRYVYLPDGTLMNLELIEEGYGHAYTYFPFDKIEEFRQAEAKARNNNVGLWGSCPI